MRPFLATGLLITLCAPADATTVYHARRHVMVRPGQAAGWANGSPHQPLDDYDYHDAPSYNDPSKFGGDEALPATP
jgi:hypothetical protein